MRELKVGERVTITLEAVECEAKEYDESPLYGCDVSVKEVED